MGEEFGENIMETQVEIVRSWIQKISIEDFENICPSYNDEINTNVASPQIVFKQKKIAKSNEDFDEIFFTDGTKYFGSSQEGVPDGRGQVILPCGRVVIGAFHHGVLEGMVKEVDPEDGSVMEVNYCRGLPHGAYRHKRLDNQLVSFGRFSQGVRTGAQFLVGTGGNSFYLGQVDKVGKLEGEGVYLYPCLYKAIVGQYKGGRLVRGEYRTLHQAVVEEGFIQLSFQAGGRGEVTYDPSTFMRISRNPLLTDEYEDETVFVRESSVPGAGEGLFARRKILGGELVSLFSGSKITKDSSRKSIKYGDQDWSDFRYDTQSLLQCLDILLVQTDSGQVSGPGHRPRVSELFRLQSNSRTQGLS